MEEEGGGKCKTYSLFSVILNSNILQYSFGVQVSWYVVADRDY